MYTRAHLSLLCCPSIRNLFAEAEVDEKKLGINSPLHIIIFDEIDAICRQRGSLVSQGKCYMCIVTTRGEGREAPGERCWCQSIVDLMCVLLSEW